MNEVRRAPVTIAEADLVSLRRRIEETRWVERETVADWSQGPPLAIMRDLMAHWRDRYDWRACEARLNAFNPCITEIDGLDIHFLHAHSPHEDALPLVLTHGWPGSVAEFLDVPFVVREQHVPLEHLGLGARVVLQPVDGQRHPLRGEQEQLLAPQVPLCLIDGGPESRVMKVERLPAQ